MYLFERVGLHTNANKNKSRVCNPGLLWGEQEDAAYHWGMTGEGPTYRECKRGRTMYGLCGSGLARGSMSARMQYINGRIHVEARTRPELGGEGNWDYIVSFIKVIKCLGCLVEGCPGRVRSPELLRDYFGWRHWKLQVIILEEGLHTQPG